MSLIQQITMPMGGDNGVWSRLSPGTNPTSIIITDLSSSGQIMVFTRLYSSSYIISIDKGNTFNEYSYPDSPDGGDYTGMPYYLNVKCSRNGDFLIGLVTATRSIDGRGRLRVSLNRGQDWGNPAPELIGKTLYGCSATKNFSAIYVCAGGSLHRSYNLGASFNLVSSEIIKQCAAVSVSEDESVLYCITESVIFNGQTVGTGNSNLKRSTDYGQTWTTIASGVSSFSTNSTGEIVFMSNRTSGGLFVISISYDFGNTWRVIYQGVRGGGGGTIQNGGDVLGLSEDGRILLFALRTNTEEIYPIGLFRSDNYGYNYSLDSFSTYFPSAITFPGGQTPSYLLTNNDCSLMAFYNTNYDGNYVYSE